jgi:hypothetical protein
MKLTNVKALIAKSLTVGLLVGAFVLAVPAKADAQQFAVGVQFGSPSYGYDSPRDYYARQRYEELCRQRAFAAQQAAYARQQAWAQQEAFERHEAWERQQSYNRFDGDRDRGWRDRDDHRARDDHRDWDRDRR